MATGPGAKTSLLEGLDLGFACIAPIWLQNLFVFNSVLVQTRSRVLLTAVDVIVFDVTLALACFFGVGAVIDRYVWLQKLILFADIFIVICIGAKLLHAQAAEVEPIARLSSDGHLFGLCRRVAHFPRSSLMEPNHAWAPPSGTPDG